MIKDEIIAIKGFRNQAFTGTISFSAGSLNKKLKSANLVKLMVCGLFVFLWC